MSNVSAIKNIIQSEEVTSEAAVSSGTATRMAESIRHIQIYNIENPTWKLNGTYGKGVGAQATVDAAVPIFTDCDIVGFFMFNTVAGSSGSTEINILRHTASGAGTSIFSVRPQISYTAGNLAYLATYLDPVLTLENPAGTTLPTFSTTQLTAGDALTLNFVQRQVSGNGLTVTVAVRPR